MEKEKLDKNYLNWEMEFKKKVLLYMNYVIGTMVVMEGIASYQNLGKIFCWEHSVYIFFPPWAFYGLKLTLRHFSPDIGAFLNANFHHVGTYVTLLTKNNYLAIIATYIIHYHMRSMFISGWKLSLLDDGITTIFLGLTFHRMANELFDQNSKCIWEFEAFKADLVDTISRIMMFHVLLHFATYLTKKKILCLNEMAGEIENKSKEKERFFACVSHELRNPLNSLLACVEILPTTPQAKQGELLSSAKTCGDTLLHLIGNILDVSKIKDKKMELNLTDADISEVMHKVILMHKIKAQNKGLYFDLIGDPSIPPCVKLDSAKFTQVITNLISNSIKFTEKGTVITKMSWIPIERNEYTNEDFTFAMEEAIEISNREEAINIIDEMPNTKSFYLDKKLNYYHGKPKKSIRYIYEPIELSPGPWISYSHSFSAQSSSRLQEVRRSPQNKEQGVLKIEIIDSGIGITEENVKKLFHPFAQADKTISRCFGGTGLGLWIAKSIIKMMGGRIKIESELDHGSNFIIVIPLFSGDEEVVLKEKNLDLEFIQNIYKGLRVLYVEDICENQMIMTQILTQMGFEIEIANNGAEGFYKFRKHPIGYFDLILTDLRMPDMSGQSMILKIKELEGDFLYNKPKIPIIVLTGDPSEHERTRCLNILKVNSFLNKPVSIHQFTVQLRKIFDTSENEEVVKYPDSQRRNYILIVEDDTLLNNLVKHFLSDYEVLQAYSVKEGVEKFQYNYGQIFAVCLDGNLQDGTGVDFLTTSREFERKVKGVPANQLVKVISTSGEPLQIQKRIYANLFVDVFLEKPFSKDVLLSALNHLEEN